MSKPTSSRRLRRSARRSAEGISKRGSSISKKPAAQHKVNDMIDRCDAFVRKATASLEAVCRNIYYRRIFYGGLQGSFRVAAEIINNLVKTQEQAVEKARLDAAAEQASLINSLAGGSQKLSGRRPDFPPGRFPGDLPADL